jgi:hypothetical protein
MWYWFKLVNNENGNLLAGTHNILSRWKTYLSQLLNVHGINDVRQMLIHTAEALVHETKPFEVEIAISSLDKYTCKLPGIDQIAGEMIQAGSAILHSEIMNELIIF